MNKRRSITIHGLVLTLALLIPLTFTQPATAAVSKCTSTITTVSPTINFVKTFTYFVFGSINGIWTSDFTFMLKNVTYEVTTKTECAPR